MAINLDQGRGWTQSEAKYFAFKTAMQGSHDGGNATSQDTDSLQVAVLWTDSSEPKPKTVGHANNVVPFPKGGNRTQGANWEFSGQMGSMSAVWRTLAPADATHVEIVMVYTDVIMNTPVDGGNDLPIIVGSFSGDLIGNVWKLTVNPKDLFKPRSAEPPAKLIPGMVDAAFDVLFSRTHHVLEPRPSGLSPSNTPAVNRAIIKKAVALRQINTSSDTGFDVSYPWK